MRTARAHFGHESKTIETLNSKDNAEREEKKDDLFQRFEEIAGEELLDKTLTPIEIAVELTKNGGKCTPGPPKRPSI